MRMVIYWDILLGINLVVNSVILFLTSVATGARVSRRRILVGALLGAVYVVISEFEVLLQAGIVKSMLSLLIVAIVFGICSWREFLFRSSVFYLISFVIGGAVLGWSYFGQEGGGVSVITLGEMSGGILIGAAAVFFCLHRTMERVRVRAEIVKVEIVCKGRQDAFCGLIDSGNLLASSFRRTPVIVAERSAVPSLVGEANDYFAQRDESVWVRDFSQCGDELWPYRSLDEAGGMLIGVRVDVAVIAMEGRRYRCRNCIVAVTNKKLSADGAYAAIVPSRLLAEGEIEEGEKGWAS